MATFAIDLISGNVFLFVPDFGGGSTGTTSGSTYPEVNTYVQLPSASANNGKIYVVRESTGAYVLNRKEAGLYYSNSLTWRRLGDIPSFFDSDNFQIYDGTDNSKTMEFETSGITSGLTRTLTIQDADGTIAYLTDLDSKVDTSAFNDYTGTTAPNTYLAISDFNTYSGTTLALIQSKQDKLIAGNGILIDTGNNISVNLPKQLQLKDISGGTEVNLISGVSINWTTEEYSGTSLNFSGGSRIYIQETASYQISYVLNVENQTGGRKNIGTVIRKNKIDDITEMSSASYSRNVSNDASTNQIPSYKVDLVVGDYFELYGFRIGTSGSVLTVPNGSWIKVEKII